MDKLNETQRRAILAKLENASDTVLLEAAHRCREIELHITERIGILREWLGGVRAMVPQPIINPLASPEVELKAFKAMSVEHPVIGKPAKNMKPKAAPAGKIGQESKQIIMDRLKKSPHTADELNGALRRGDARLGDTESLLALMWMRGEIVFDGEMYGPA